MRNKLVGGEGYWVEGKCRTQNQQTQPRGIVRDVEVMLDIEWRTGIASHRARRLRGTALHEY